MKSDEIWKKSGTTYYLGCKVDVHKFKPQEIKMRLCCLPI